MFYFYLRLIADLPTYCETEQVHHRPLSAAAELPKRTAAGLPVSGGGVAARGPRKAHVLRAARPDVRDSRLPAERGR